MAWTSQGQLQIPPPAQSMFSAHYVSGAWEPRPTDRTDVTVFYVKHSASDPDPTDFVAGTDLIYVPQE